MKDTLKSPPPENQTMKKASINAIVITTFFYLCCSCFGYAAFGNDTPGNLLTGFYEPFWLVDFANACIVLHLVGGYQVVLKPESFPSTLYLVYDNSNLNTNKMLVSLGIQPASIRIC